MPDTRITWPGLNFDCSCTACKAEFGSHEMDAVNPDDPITRKPRWDVCPKCEAEGTVEFAMRKNIRGEYIRGES